MEVLGIDRGITIKWILQQQDVRAWFGIRWFRIGTSNGLWYTR